ncbi:MAG: P1 family peptidase [Limnohabitans sp.]|jgi:L-aminopeptidase/D-esterase-like protein
MMKATHNNSLTSLQGILVGHYTDDRRPTGCTVVLCPEGAVAGVDVRGAAPGTRDTEALSPSNTVQVVHGVLLTGGSAYGLDAAGGVMRWLEERGHGFQLGPAIVPVVPAAVIFDLWVDDFSGDTPTKSLRIRPDLEAGYLACQSASSEPVLQGNVGAGAGATLGKLNGPDCAMKGGIGSASLCVNGVTVAALVVCNALGDVIDPQTGQLLAGARISADSRTLMDIRQAQLNGHGISKPQTGSNTTIGVVATDAVLNKPQAHRLAQVAHDGLARSIRPVHTPMDGDTLFALGTGTSGQAADMMLLSTLAAEVTAMAVVNAVRAAKDLRFGQGWWPAIT